MRTLFSAAVVGLPPTQCDRAVVLLRLMFALGLCSGRVMSPGAEPQDAQAKSDGLQFTELFNGRDLSGWVDVNTSPDTWKARDGLLVCSGQPIGVMRSEKQYEKFLLHIEWRH